MKPHNIEVSRRLAHKEIGSDVASRLFIPEVPVSRLDGSTTIDNFVLVWDALQTKIDIFKSEKNIGIYRTFPNTVTVDVEGRTSSYLLNFVLYDRDPSNRAIQAIWEHLPPAYSPIDEVKTYRRSEVVTERLLRSGAVDSMLDVVQTAYDAYTANDPTSTSAV